MLSVGDWRYTKDFEQCYLMITMNKSEQVHCTLKDMKVGDES